MDPDRSCLQAVIALAAQDADLDERIVARARVELTALTALAAAARVVLDTGYLNHSVEGDSLAEKLDVVEELVG